MNKLSTAKRATVIAALVEGVSVRATSRMTGVCKPTILRLLVEVGDACARFHHETVRGLKCRRIECDEIWQYVYAKKANVPAEKKGEFGYGDSWTWTAIDSETKLIVSYFVGSRDSGSAYEFMTDLACRVTSRPQITTDAFTKYANVIDEAFGSNVDYASITKVYGRERGEETRYSPAKIITTRKEVIKGRPDPQYISTSYVERQNLTMRMHMRRFTRLTNAFSKKIENHCAAVNLHFLFYNFCRVHQTLRVTPAMQAGLADHVWSLEEVVGLLDAADKKAA